MIYRDNRESLEAQLRRSEEELRLTKSDLELVKRVRERHVHIDDDAGGKKYMPLFVSSLVTFQMLALRHWKMFFGCFAVSFLLYLVMIVRMESQRRP